MQRKREYTGIERKKRESSIERKINKWISERET